MSVHCFGDLSLEIYLLEICSLFWRCYHCFGDGMLRDDKTRFSYSTDYLRVYGGYGQKLSLNSTTELARK